MSEEEFECPRCRGMGWISIRTDQRPGNDPRPHDHVYPDCSECSGTGVLTKEQLDVFYDRSVA